MLWTIQIERIIPHFLSLLKVLVSATTPGLAKPFKSTRVIQEKPAQNSAMWTAWVTAWTSSQLRGVAADIDDIYRNILLANNIDVLRHIVVLLLCIVKES